MINIELFRVKTLKLISLSIILYFIYVYLFKPAANFVRMVIHYHGFPSNSRHFLLGHLKQVWTNFPFPNDMESVTRNIYEMARRTVIQNPDRSVSVAWITIYPVIITSDHEAVEIVLNKKNLKKPHFYNFIGLGNGLVVSEPVLWKARRKLVEPFFSTKKLKGHVKIMYNEVESLPQQLNEVIGKHVDLENQIHNSSLNIILKAAVNIPFDDSIEDKKVLIEAVSEGEANSVKRGSNPLYYFDWALKFFEFGKSYFKAIDMIGKLNKTILRRRKQLIESKPLNEPEDGDFINLLEGKVDEKGMLDELINIILAGHETTAVGLRWLLFNLGNHLDEQEKLYQEIIEYFPDDTPVDDMDRINRCNYLDQCVKESLRLNPPIHAITRLLEEDVVVKDKRLLKGSMVTVLIDTTHRDPSVYPNPDTFDPERWNLENVSKIPKAAFIPFGYGPRSCIGWRYAMIELKIYAIQIIRKFSLRSPRKHGSIPLKSEVTLKPVLPLEIMLTPRNNNQHNPVS